MAVEEVNVVSVVLMDIAADGVTVIVPLLSRLTIPIHTMDVSTCHYGVHGEVGQAVAKLVVQEQREEPDLAEEDRNVREVVAKQHLVILKHAFTGVLGEAGVHVVRPATVEHKSVQEHVQEIPTALETPDQKVKVAL